MKIRKFKKLFGLCQCKGCLKPAEIIVATYYGRKYSFYPARVCTYHACNLIQFNYTE